MDNSNVDRKERKKRDKRKKDIEIRKGRKF